MVMEAIQNYSSQDLACDGEERDSTVAVPCLAVSFVFVEVNNGGILEVLGQLNGFLNLVQGGGGV